MPTVFRSMKAAADGLPVVGDRSKELGVRVPPNPHADVDVDPNTNLVVLNQKGMSVAENWRLLPPHLIPMRLASVVKDAKGLNYLKCYRLGDGPFVPGLLANGLEVALKPGVTDKGNVVPSAPVTVSQFQADLGATRNQWVADET
jgi:hypothetical protein